LRATRLAYQLDMIDVRGPVDPVICTRQRRHGTVWVEWSRSRHCAFLQSLGHFEELGTYTFPIIQRRLQCHGNLRDGDGLAQVAADDDQLAVARTVTQRCKLHLFFQLST
jgi:hypothetical protein